MTEEIKTETKENECKCFCRSEGVKKFVVVALGTFVGVYCALSLFAALHRPPMMPPCHFGPGMGPQIQYGQHFKRMHRGDFHRIDKQANFDKKPAINGERAPFQAPGPNFK